MSSFVQCIFHNAVDVLDINIVNVNVCLCALWCAGPGFPPVCVQSAARLPPPRLSQRCLSSPQLSAAIASHFTE